MSASLVFPSNFSLVLLKCCQHDTTHTSPAKPHSLHAGYKKGVKKHRLLSVHRDFCTDEGLLGCDNLQVCRFIGRRKVLPPSSGLFSVHLWHLFFLCLILCFVGRSSLYNLVNKSNLVHNLFLVYLSNSTCFGRLWAHRQEKQLCFCDNWYLLFCVDGCLLCRVERHSTNSNLHTRESSTQNNKYQVSQKHSCFSWWWAHIRPKHVEINKYTKNKLSTKLVLFTRHFLLLIRHLKI